MITMQKGMLMNIQKEAEGAAEELTALRRYFHTHPEVSEKEFGTMDFIEKKLKEMGISSVRVEHGGTAAVIDSGRPGYTVLLRADIDALPIMESETNLRGKKACLSAVPGISHACGHDGHMAMQLAAARILENHKQEWAGKVVLMFEEGEENGSRCLIQIFRWMEEQGIHPDTCYATHVRWDIPAGRVAILPGAAMAGVFAFHVRIDGTPGHGSRPDMAVSPLDCFVSFYQALQNVRMTKISPEECLTFSVGSIQGGKAPNVIPGSLRFAGTCRFFGEEAGKRFEQIFMDYLDSECRRCGCTPHIESIRHSVPVMNHPRCAEMARKALEESMGPGILYEAPRWMASESMGITLQMFPGIMSFTGIQDVRTGSGAPHHTPEFDIEEKGLTAGLAAVLSYTETMLEQKPDLSFTPVSLDEIAGGMKK